MHFRWREPRCSLVTASGVPSPGGDCETLCRALPRAPRADIYVAISRRWRSPRMRTYMVERDLKGITMDQLAAAQQRAISTGKEMTSTGKDVRYIRSVFVPGEARCMCLFESSNPAHV